MALHVLRTDQVFAKIEESSKFHLKSSKTHVSTISTIFPCIPPIPLLPTNRAVLPRAYPVSLKSTKLASPRLLTMLLNSTVYVSGAQERRRGVVCKYRRRQEDSSRGCTECIGTSGWGGSSTGEQSTPQEFDPLVGGSIAGEQGDRSSVGGVDKGSAGAREGVNGVTD